MLKLHNEYFTKICSNHSNAINILEEMAYKKKLIDEGIPLNKQTQYAY